jgi:hypothetical protein
MKYKIEIGGRGGEVVIGTVQSEFYDLVQENEIDFDDYAWNSDFFEENEGLEIPEDIRPFEPGEWFDHDDLGHNNGPAVDDCYISITDENDNVIYDALTLDQFYDLGADSEQTEEVYPQETLEDGDVYFIGQSFEKGHFLSFECEDEAFDPKKLMFMTSDYDGWELVTGLTYNSQTLDDLGELSTSGKGSEFQLIQVEKES